jgi:hypothetical protein
MRALGHAIMQCDFVSLSRLETYATYASALDVHLSFSRARSGAREEM